MNDAHQHTPDAESFKSTRDTIDEIYNQLRLGHENSNFNYEDVASILFGTANFIPDQLLPEVIQVITQLPKGAFRDHFFQLFLPRIPNLAQDKLKALPWGQLIPYLTLEQISTWFTVMLSNRSEWEQIEIIQALAHLINQLPLIETLTLNRESDLWPNLLKIAFAIRYSELRIKILGDLIPHVPIEERRLIERGLLAMANEVSPYSYQPLFIQILPVLTPDLLPEALTIAADILDVKARTAAIAAFATYLPEDQLSEYLELVRSLGSAEQVSILTVLYHRFSGVIPSIEEELISSLKRANSDTVLIPALNQLFHILPQSHLTELRSIIQVVTDANSKAQLLADLALRLAPEERGDIINEALLIARTSPYTPRELNKRAKLVANLADLLPQHERSQIYDEAIDMARTASAPGQALIALVPHLPIERRLEIMSEAIETNTYGPSWYVKWLSQTLLQLPPELQLNAVHQLFLAAQDVVDPEYREQLIASSIRQMPDELLPEVGPTILQEIQKFSFAERIKTIDNLRNRAPGLLESHNFKFDHSDLAMAKTIQWAEGRAEAIINILPLLPDDLWSEAIVIALNATQTLEYEYKVSEMLARIAHLASSKFPIEAIRAAALITNDYERGTTLVALIPKLPSAFYFKLLDAAEIEPKFNVWPRLFRELSPHLTSEKKTALINTALESAQQIKEPVTKAQALSNLLPLVTTEAKPSFIEEIFRTMRMIGEPYGYIEVFDSIISHLPQLEAASVVEEAVAFARDIEDLEVQGYLFSHLFGHMPESEREHWLAEAGPIERSAYIDYWRRMRTSPHFESDTTPLELLSTTILKHPDGDRQAQIESLIEEWKPGFSREKISTLFNQLPEKQRTSLLREQLELLSDWLRKALELSRSRLLASSSPALSVEMHSESRQLLSRENIHSNLALSLGMHSESKQLLSRERVVSTGFASVQTATEPLPSEQPLTYSQDYYFWLEIGAPVQGSIENNPIDLPADNLPKNAQLQVVLFGLEDEIEIRPGADTGEIQIQPNGQVRVVRQPFELSEPEAKSELFEQRLLFPVRTPEIAGSFTLRCHIYYKQILIQSRIVRASVMFRPELAQGRRQARALTSIVDYAMTRTMDWQQLEGMQTHQASFMLNSSGNATHGFAFFTVHGEEPVKNNVLFNGTELQDLIQMTRGALRKAAWGDEEPWQQGENQAYRYGGSTDIPQLSKDLTYFAIKGFRLYDAIINRLAGNAARARQLRQAMRTPGLVQIALQSSANHVLPVAMIYDYSLDTNLNLNEYSLCPTFTNAMSSSNDLKDCACFQGSCPSRQNENADSIICPSGFWGYRHALGLPVSLSSAPDIPNEIRYQQQSEMIVAVSTDPALVLRKSHEQKLRDLCSSSLWNYGETRREVLNLLMRKQAHVVYFYCHGGISNNTPYLQVGPRDERGITRDNIRNEEICWSDSRPLVFLNGCHTVALEPEKALEFVTAFVENAFASGVIGTEITVFEHLASYFAEEFLQRFMRGISVGDAIRETRLKLLKSGNPLGLAYVPYALGNLRMSPS